MPVARPVRLLALALGWGLAGALALAAAPARAECLPDPATAGDTVTCSADDDTGFDAVAEDDLTVVVESTATVDDGVADANAITLNDRNGVTVEAGAAITADGPASHGISIGNDNNPDNGDMDGDGVTNAGDITVTGDNAGGIVGGNANDVTNEGSISAGTAVPSTGAFGIRLGTDATVTNAAGAAIGVLGNDVVGIEVGDDSSVTNEGSVGAGVVGTTTGGSIGVDAGDDALITNEAGGTISAGGADPIGLRMGSDTSPDMDADLVNRGTISAEGGLTSATGVIVGDDVVVHNESLSAIEATGNQPDPMNMDLPAGVPVIGIQLGADTTLENDGRIQTDGAESTAVLVTGGAGSTTTIINGPTGQILTPYDPDDPDVVDDPVDGSVAIQGGDGIEIVTHQGALNGIIDLAGNDDQLTLFTGTSFDVLIGGGGTDALILDGGGAGLLDLDLVSEFESIEIDAMVTDMDAMPPEDFFGTWELQDSTPMSTLSLPDGLTLTNGTLRLRDAVTIDSATGFVMGAGTTFQVLVDPNEMTNGDLVVTNGGNLDLSALDNTLDVIQLAPITASTTITVLESSAGALNGVFENVPMDTPLLAYQVNHLASSVTVDITRFSYGVVAETPNQGAVGEYLDRVLAAGGNSPGVDAVLVVLDALGADQLRNAYDGLHPEAYDAHTGQVAALGRAFAEAAIEPRLRCKPAFFGLDPGPLRDVPCGRSGFTAWMKLLFSESNRDGGGDYFDSDGSRRAVAGGFDWRPDRRVTVTGYIGIGSVDVDVKGVGNGDIQSYEIGGAVAARLGAGRLSATLGYGRGDHEQNRRLDFGAFGTDTIQGNFNSNRIQSMIEAAWLFELGDLQLEPLARMDVTWVQEDAFSESDLGGYELEVDERSEVLFGTQFGGRLRYRHHQSAYADDVIPYTQGTWTPEISASWRSLWSGADRETTARFAGAGDAGDLKVESEDSQQGVDVGAKLTFQPHGSGGSFSIGYDGFFGDKSTDHRFGAALEVYF